MRLKSFTLKIQAQIIDHDGGAEIVKQEVVFDGRAPAIHNAIEKMGASFVYGLSVSLSREMLGLLDEKKVETVKKGGEKEIVNTLCKE